MLPEMWAVCQFGIAHRLPRRWNISRNWWINCHNCICIASKLSWRSLITDRCASVCPNVVGFESDLDHRSIVSCVYVCIIFFCHSLIARIAFNLFKIKKYLRNDLIKTNLYTDLHLASTWAISSSSRKTTTATATMLNERSSNFNTATRFVCYCTNDDIDETCANDKW